MSDFSCATPITALRKTRQCFWCQGLMPLGTAGVRIAGVWEGTFSVLYVHPECNTAWERDPCNADWEGCPYEHERGKTCADAPREPPVRIDRELEND